eukprot:8802336-Ditylum_brightwellii.AAC.1
MTEDYDLYCVKDRENRKTLKGSMRWKDDGAFTCRSSLPVKPYIMKQQLQCYDHHQGCVV